MPLSIPFGLSPYVTRGIPADPVEASTAILAALASVSWCETGKHQDWPEPPPTDFGVTRSRHPSTSRYLQHEDGSVLLLLWGDTPTGYAYRLAPAPTWSATTTPPWHPHIGLDWVPLISFGDEKTLKCDTLTTYFSRHLHPDVRLATTSLIPTLQAAVSVEVPLAVGHWLAEFCPKVYGFTASADQIDGITLLVLDRSLPLDVEPKACINYMQLKRQNTALMHAGVDVASLPVTVLAWKDALAIDSLLAACMHTHNHTLSVSTPHGVLERLEQHSMFLLKPPPASAHARAAILHQHTILSSPPGSSL